MSIWSAAFWRAATERAIRTAAQTAVATLTAGATGLLEVDWAAVGSVSGMAAVLSVLTSVATGAVQGDGPGVTETPTRKE